MTKIPFSKKIFLLFFVFCFLLSVISPIAALAQDQDWVFGGDDPIRSMGEAKDAAVEENEVNAEAMAEFQFRQFAGAALCAAGGIACTANPEKEEGFRKNSALGQTGNLIAALYAHPPATLETYLVDVGKNIGLVPKAYAQGIGFAGLSPIIDLWKVFRNLAYMLIVFILIIIGFMVMFRMKIDPQTVISIQNALPRIAVTLLLITFSYAIAGFLIDLMYLAILLVISVLGQGGAIPGGATDVVQTRYLTEGVRNLFGGVFGAGLRSVDDLTKLISGGWLSLTDFDFLIGWLAHAITGIIILLLLVFVLLFVFIRIFLTLLNSYIQIVLSIIFAPFQLMFGALPGQNSFGGWLKGLIANLLVFPATAAILILAMFFTTQNVEIWTPPMLSTWAGGGVTGLIGLGLVLFIPTLLNKIKEMFAAKPALPVGLGMVTGPAVGGVMGAWNLVNQALMTRSYIKRPEPPAGESPSATELLQKILEAVQK